MKRTSFLFILYAIPLLLPTGSHAGPGLAPYFWGKKEAHSYKMGRSISDVSRLTHTPIAKILKPTSIQQLAKLLPQAKAPISVAGGRYSQGGQVAARNGTVIDLTGLNKIVHLDLHTKQITVETGITWRAIQEAIDPHNFSVSIMQSYADFTVGGSLSVNVHGRGVHCGPLISSVISLKVMLPDGTVMKASRTKNKDLFFAAIGGYGCMGIIVEATLQLTDNVPLERRVKTVSLKEYTAYFLNHIKTNPNAVFHNGNLYPSAMNKVVSVTWYKTDKEPTISHRLQPLKQFYAKEMLTEQIYRRSRLFKMIRAKFEPFMLKKKMVVWRNHEMSYTVKAHEPLFRFPTTTVLQEYFVPVKKLEQFVAALDKTIRYYGINMLNISIRYVPQDKESTLAYAQQDSFALVLYFNMPNTQAGKKKAQNWTRTLIHHATRMGGTYYLPYQLYATKKQFRKAYPQFEGFLKIKKKYDPLMVFSNELFATYGR